MKLNKILMVFLFLWPASAMLSGQEQVDTLDASRIVTGKIQRDRNSTQTGLQQLDVRKLNRGFAIFNTPDLIKTLQTLPGVSAGTELISGLYVRGGDGSDNLFLLDGAPLYQAGHFGGIFSSFNSDVIESVDFYKGGFPARYGGKMSSVVDVTTKDGDFQEFHGTFSLALIDGHFQFEGPIVRGKTSFNVGLRRTWLDMVTTPILLVVNQKAKKEAEGEDAEKYNARYNFSDLNASVTHLFSADSKLKLSFFAGLDRLPVRAEMPESTGTWDESRYTPEHFGTSTVDVGLKWGNILGSARWDYKFNDALTGTLSTYYSRNISKISADLSEWCWENDTDTYLKYGESVDAAVEDTGIRLNFDWFPRSAHHIRFGGTAVYHGYHPSRKYYTGTESPAGSNYVREAYDLPFRGAEGAAFMEDEMSITSWLTGNLGLRYALFNSSGKTWNALEPRASVKVHLFKDFDVKASYAEMNQFSHQISTCYIDLPTNTWMPSTSIIKPMLSRQVSAGLYYDLTDNLNLSAEGWYKTMDHLYEYSGTNMLYPPLERWETQFTEGRGRSWGLEAGLEWESEKLMAELYYTLSWNQRKFDDMYFGWYPDRNDNRHKITLMANYYITPRFEVYAAWNYHSGNHITAATYRIRTEGDSRHDWEAYDRPNSVQFPAYHRMDLGMSWHKTTRRGNERTWNLSIYNAYCRMNAIFARIDPIYEQGYNPDGSYYYNDTGKYKGVALGIVPIIPTFGYTLKF